MNNLDKAVEKLVEEGLEIGYQMRAVVLLATSVFLWITVSFLYNNWSTQYPFWLLVFSAVFHTWIAGLDIIAVVGAHVLRWKRKSRTEKQ